MPGLREVLRVLRTAFAEGGVESLHQAHLHARQTSLRYGFAYGLLDILLPLSPLVAIVVDLERNVGAYGVSEASRATLARTRVPWRAEMPSLHAPIVRASPAIYYGTHGSILTPLLLAAALGRPDLKMVAASYISNLGPHIATHCFAVHPATRVSARRAGRKGLVPRAMGWIAARADPGVDRVAAQAQNREALALAAEHVRGGGGLLIAPDSRDHRAAWRQGIGALVVDLAASPGSKPAVLVPWHISGASITGTFQLVSRNPLWRALGRHRYRRPVCVAFGEPLALPDVVRHAGLDRERITAYLEHHYRALNR